MEGKVPFPSGEGNSFKGGCSGNPLLLYECLSTPTGFMLIHKFDDESILVRTPTHSKEHDLEELGQLEQLETEWGNGV
jgi:hypothetical protein